MDSNNLNDKQKSDEDHKTNINNGKRGKWWNQKYF